MAVAYADLTDPSRPYDLFVTIDGSEYLFCASAATGVAFTNVVRDDDWCTDAREWIILPCALDLSEGLRFSESVVPLEGDVEVSNVTFRLHDLTPTSGGAAGYPVMSYMGAREDVPSTPLATAIDANDTAVVVEDGAIFPSGATDFVVWVGREAMLAGNRTGDTITIYASGRGVLGSKARAYSVNADEGVAPAVFATFPGLDRRRVVLWIAPNIDGVLTDPVPLWRGFVTTGGPRLVASGDGRAAVWELSCDSVVSQLGEVPIGTPVASCTVHGYSVAQRHYIMNAKLTVHTSTPVDAGPLTAYTPAAAPGSANAYFETLQDMCNYLQNHLHDRVNLAGIGNSISIAATGRTVTLSGNIVAGQNIHAELESPVASPTVVRASVTDSTTGAIPPVVMSDYPACVASVSTSVLSPVAVRMDSVEGLPATGWPGAGAVGATSRLVAALAAVTDGYRVELIPTSSDVNSDTVVDTTNRTVKGYVRLFRGTSTAQLPTDTAIPGVLTWYGSDAVLIAPLTFNLVATVDTASWVDGLHAAVADTGYTIGGASWPSPDVDPRDWDWTRADRVAAAIPALLARRHWIFDGTETVRDVLCTNELFSGGCPGIRRSRLCPDIFLPPTRSDVFDDAHTFDGSVDPLDLPGWASAPDGIANLVSVTLGNVADSASTTWVLQDRNSVERYGSRRRLEIDIKGLDATPEILAQGPRALTPYLVGRVLGLWSRPTRVATIKASLSRLDTVRLMDAVRVINDDLLPNAAGMRGWDDVRGVVVGRDVELIAGKGGVGGSITFRVMHWPLNALGGWSPCVRIASSVAGTKTLTVATGYITGATAFGDAPALTDYAHSTADDYANPDVGTGTEQGDGGTGYFATGYACELLLRDATTAIRELVTVDTVNASTRTITLTSAQSAVWANYIAAGLTVDLRFVYDYEAQTEAQQRYATVGGRAGHDIEGNTDHPNFRWSP